MLDQRLHDLWLVNCVNEGVGTDRFVPVEPPLFLQENIKNL